MKKLLAIAALATFVSFSVAALAAEPESSAKTEQSKCCAKKTCPKDSTKTTCCKKEASSCTKQ